MNRYILLLTVAGLLGGCAPLLKLESSLFPQVGEYRDARARYAEFGCRDYPMVSWPSFAKHFDVEPRPAECDRLLDYFAERARRSPLAGMEGVTIYDASTGRTTYRMVPKGAVIVGSGQRAD